MKPDETKATPTFNGSPGKLTLGGAVYLISQPTPQDMGAITLEVKRHALSPLAKLVNDPAFKQLPEFLQGRAVDRAATVQATGEHGLSGGEVLDLLVQPDCLAFAIWVLARKNHPGLKLEQIRSHITPENAGEVFVNFAEASGIDRLGNSVGAPGSQESSTG